MSVILALLHVFGGIVWLVLGGDVLVRGAMSLAARARVSPLAVGVTVVALGTSAPELVVSLRATLVGLPDLALGNVVGSNIANVLMVVGLPAIIYPMNCAHPGARADGRIMLFASALFFLLCAMGPLGRGHGLALMVALVLFLIHVVGTSRPDPDVVPQSKEMDRILGLPTSPHLIVAFIVFGGLALPLGAELLIRGAVAISERLGVSNAVVGLTVIAVGTSLPELATTLVAAVKREAELAVGNVIGSNVLNILAIMGITTLASPHRIQVPATFMRLHLPVMLAAALILTYQTERGRTVSRALGVALFAGYVLFTTALY